MLEISKKNYYLKMCYIHVVILEKWFSQVKVVVIKKKNKQAA